MEEIAKDYQEEWDKNGTRLLTALSDIIEMQWPQDCSEIKSWI